MTVISHADLDRMFVARDVDGLIRALTTAESMDVRQLAAKALGKVGDPRATEPLINALRDRNIVRSYVADALGQMGEPAFNLLIKAVADPETRWGAVTALGAIGDKRAIEHIIKFCTSVDSLLRGAAVIAIGRIGGNRAVETLIYVAEKEEGFIIGTFAIEALGEIGGASAREALVRATKHPHADTRYAAKEALKKIEIGGWEAASEPLVMAGKVDYAGNLAGESPHARPALGEVRRERSRAIKVRESHQECAVETKALEFIKIGRMLDAIKLLLQETSLDREEAKEYANILLETEVRELVARDDKVNAAKLVRRAKGISLHETMEYIRGL